MRVSDYIIQFLRDNYGVDTFFTVSGGGCIFLIDSLGNTEGVNYIATHHEQAAAMAAEGYSRINNKLGACVVTSGPGGTNVITGTLCSWLDSIPVIVISGQVNKELTTNYTNLDLRQLGDQEFDIIKTVKSITKYAVQVNNSLEIRYHLEKACSIAMQGRPGPVWLDIPLDVQSDEINPLEIIGYEDDFVIPEPSESEIDNLIEKWENSKKPLMIVGNGIRLSRGEKKLHEILKETDLPVISAVNGNDLVNEDYPYYYGRFGTHAQICANKLLGECDFVLSVGTRLYVRQTGYNFKGFANQAYKIHVDIDRMELDKPTLHTDLKIHSDASSFFDKILERILPKTGGEWINFCDDLKINSPRVLDRHRTSEKISHYAFMEELSKCIPKDYHIITSNGSANIVTMQVLDLHGSQRLITNSGCAPMGYGLPAAVGASINHKIVCLEGDGSLHLNIHELQTMKHYNLPIKLILLNNDGYTSIKLSQQAFFKGKYVASERGSGVSFPNFKKIMEAYDLPYMSISKNEEIKHSLEDFFENEGPCVLEVFSDPDEPHEPKVINRMKEDGKFIPGDLGNIKWMRE